MMAFLGGRSGIAQTQSMTAAPIGGLLLSRCWGAVWQAFSKKPALMFLGKGSPSENPLLLRIFHVLEHARFP